MSKEQVVREIHKTARKNFPRRHTIVKGLNDLMQIDLMEFIPYERINKGYRYILVAINCFSKYVWIVPLKTKTSAEVVKSMVDRILPEFIPRNIQSDDGKEFFNKMFRDMCSKHSINHYSTYSTIKASIVERVIRTLKNLIYRQFSLNGNYKWINFIDEVVKKYNNTVHSTIHMKPLDANKKKNETKILKSVYRHLKIMPKNNRYKVGDFVRISKYKSVFAKGYTPNFSTELFKIVKVQVTNPVTYILEDTLGHKISGAFYEQEIQKTKYPDLYLVEKILRYKGNKVYVSWLGLDKTHNSWILKKDIL